MKKSLFVLSGVLLAMFAGSAGAESVVPYAAIKVGQAQTDWKHHWKDNGVKYRGSYSDSAGFVSVAGGVDFAGPLRAELEYSIFGDQKDSKQTMLYRPGYYYQRYDIKEKLEFQTLLVNGYWDFKNSTSLTPYVGVGLGLAYINATGRATAPGAPSVHTSLKGVASAYNAAVGVAWSLNDSLSLDVAYRYLGINVDKIDLEQQQVQVGVRWGF
ncbi:MAG: porin family protein [Azoarcus sp.]|jgi:opacity protein-like surface antigen|nr:porin family protein [Azoarcus sp.]